ncbi:MAG: hypothetical protein COA61_006130 [Zetaproteobacteria bacterium]|nr:hypothetical protein [Zetaproteobacteria bacterium]
MNILSKITLTLVSLCWAIPASAIDSYRYMHVNIETPWAIFVFLFGLVFAPMILAVILYWRYAMKKDEEEDDHDRS